MNNFSVISGCFFGDRPVRRTERDLDLGVDRAKVVRNDVP